MSRINESGSVNSPFPSTFDQTQQTEQTKQTGQKQLGQVIADKSNASVQADTLTTEGKPHADLNGNFSTSTSSAVPHLPLPNSNSPPPMPTWIFDRKDPNEIYNAIIDHQTGIALGEPFPNPADKTKGISDSAVSSDNNTNKSVSEKFRSNPFFNKSFLASFSAIMDQLLNLKRNTTYLESQVELKSRELTIEITKNQSELTKMIAEAQSAEKMVDAITSFIQAGVAGVSLAQTWNNAAAARKDADAIRKGDIEAEQKHIETLQAKKQEIEKPKSNIVSTESDAIGAPQPLTREEKQKIAQIDKDIEAHQKSIQNMERPEYLRQLINTRTQELNLQSDLKQQIVKSVVSGIGSAIQAGIISERGALEAVKTMNDGYLELIRKYSDAANKAAGQEGGDFNNLIDFVNKLFDNVYKAHSLVG